LVFVTDFTIRRNDGVELEIDVSSAETIQDVIDAINDHTLNQDPDTLVLARIPEFGNGIELVDSSAEGNNNLTILKGPSGAAWDLGFIPRGEFSYDASFGAPAAGSTASIRFDTPYDENTALSLVGNVPGPHLDDIAIEFVESGAVVGDLAAVTFDPVSQRLLIDIDQSATTIATVVSQITLEGTFTSELVVEVDGSNDGSGLVSTLGPVGATGDGVANTAAEAAELEVVFPVPFDTNTALVVTANNPGIAFNGVDVIFTDSGAVSGNAAQVSYNDVAGTITIDIDAAATSANTVVDAFRFEPLFAASLDEATANDGTGIIGFTGSSGKPISCRCWILSRRADLA
jgi:flagellar hook-associated protein 3 FlgL